VAAAIRFEREAISLFSKLNGNSDGSKAYACQMRCSLQRELFEVEIAFFDRKLPEILSCLFGVNLCSGTGFHG